MTYDKIARFRVGPPHQYGDVLIEKRHQQGRSAFAYDEALWSFAKAGISLHSRSPENKARDADSGAEGSLYGKAAEEPGFSCKTACRFFRGFIEQHSYASPKGISQKKGAWPGDIMNCLIPNPHQWIMSRLCLFQRKDIVPHAFAQVRGDPLSSVTGL